MPLVAEHMNDGITKDGITLYLEDKEWEEKGDRKYVYVYDDDDVTIELLDSTCKEPVEAIFERCEVQSPDERKHHAIVLTNHDAPDSATRISVGN